MSLKTRFQNKKIVVMPGVYDGLTASLAEAAGFEALYLSGAAVAYTRLGRPDIGLTTASEMADTLTLIADRTSLPVIIDADTGFGNALNAQRTMRLYERAGASALQIEDQTFPKRCGHLSEKSLISTGEMVGKIAAMADARTSDETLIIARTDAIAVEGFSAAEDRAEAYLEAGADILFVEGPNSHEEMQAICDRFAGRVPLLANMVEGGKTPIKSADDLATLGYSIAIFPGGAVRAISCHLQAYYNGLLSDGNNACFADRMHDFNGLNEIIETSALLELSKNYEDIDSTD